MLQWFRVRAVQLAALTIAALAVVGVWAVVPHQDDPHDAYAVIVHDASAHRAEAATDLGEGHPFHCLVCHWARTFRPHSESRITANAATEAGTNLPLPQFPVSAAAFISQPPLRSPPSLAIA